MAFQLTDKLCFKILLRFVQSRAGVQGKRHVYCPDNAFIGFGAYHRTILYRNFVHVAGVARVYEILNVLFRKDSAGRGQHIAVYVPDMLCRGIVVSALYRRDEPCQFFIELKVQAGGQGFRKLKTGNCSPRSWYNTGPSEFRASCSCRPAGRI